MSEVPVRPPRRSAPLPPTTPPASLNDVQKFKWLYKEAYDKVDTAVSLIAENKHSEAQPLLEAGLSLLNQAIDVEVSSLAVDEDTAKSYVEMQTKMRCTRKKVEEHLATNKLFSGVTGSSGYPMVAEPPSYEVSLDGVHYPELPGEETTPRVSLPPTPSPTTAVPPHLNLGSAGASPLVTPLMSPQEGTLIFKIEDGVQIFFIYPDGRVTSPSYPSFLEIVTLHSPLNITSVSGSAKGFLQVGEWSYPLVKATSPVLHSSYGAYMFPDFANPVPGTHVGIIIPDSISKDQRDLFESILNQMTFYHELPQQQDDLAAAAAVSAAAAAGAAAAGQSKTERIASGIVAGG
ncbi:hypothetical protein FHG87_008409 [Trinorchestia longiramus]|nr:hypothetical protein FHG87_008409 [Trinorchestia longiramus]